MHLIPTVTLGELAVACSIVTSAFGLYLGLVDRLARIETKIDPLWLEYQERRKSAPIGG